MPRHATDLREEIGAHFSRLDLLGRRTCRLARGELHLQQCGREAPAQLLELRRELAREVLLERLGVLVVL